MKNSKVAFLWDESFLWGIMAYKALKNIGLPFDLIRASDISDNVLDHYKMLFVPGGWASNKSKALGEDGIERVRRFVESGGSYLGFCGGAGLATKAKGGIGLLDVQRKPTRERVPSFSGRIVIDINDHPIWEGLIQGSEARGQVGIDLPTGQAGLCRGSGKGKNSLLISYDAKPVFHAWWPSQFVITDETVKSLASFGNALPDAFSSDLPAGDVSDSGNWDELEKRYQIHLNPERLIGEPAVVEGSFGKGKVILSLLHFDTPGDSNGREVLIQLWNYLAGETKGTRGQGVGGTYETANDGNIIQEMYDVCAELILLGERNFLWFWRNAMLLQWRRGVRGLEYNTLYVMIKEIANIMHDKNYANVSQCVSAPESIRRMLNGFIEKAKNLLLLERLELQRGPITYIQCEDPQINKMRKELFGGAKSHGGMFKRVLDEVDGLLYELLTNC